MGCEVNLNRWLQLLSSDLGYRLSMSLTMLSILVVLIALSAQYAGAKMYIKEEIIDPTSCLEMGYIWNPKENLRQRKGAK
jgi:hypothetical protein